MLAALIAPPPLASAQGVVGGANFVVGSLASAANPGDRTIGFLWIPGAAQSSYRLVRMSAIGTTSITVTPSQFGALDFFTEVLPAGVNSACYQLLALGSTGNVLGRSDLECVVLGTASLAVPALARIELDQSTTARVSWEAAPGASGYIVWGIGTDGFQFTTGTSLTVETGGLLTCQIVIAVNAANASIGASNVLCAFPGESQLPPGGATLTPVPPTVTGTPPTGTATRTLTGTVLTATPTITATRTETATGTPGTATPTITPTNTLSPTPTRTLIPGGVDLTVGVSSNPNPVSLGGFLTHTLTVSNNGSAATGGVRVDDPLPVGQSFFMAADVDGAGFVCSWTAGTVSCTGGTLSSGQQARIQIFARVASCPPLSPVANTATVDPLGIIAELSEGNNSGTALTTVTGCLQATATVTPTTSITPTANGTSTTVPTQTLTRTATPTATLIPGGVDLAITVSSSPNPVTVSSPPNPAGIGVFLTYSVTVHNLGDTAVSGITVQDVLPPGQVFALATDQDENGFSCSESGGTVTCSGGSLGVGGSGRITIVANVQGCPPISPIGNTVRVDPGNTIAELNETNNAATVFTTVLGTGCLQATNTPTVTGVPGTPTNTATPVIPTPTGTVPTATQTATATQTSTATSTATQTATATPVNAVPVLAATDLTLINYSENDPPTTILPTLTVNDADSPLLVGATVQIIGGLQSGQDVLGFPNPNGITATYNPGSGTLTLTGTTTVANYQTALRSVTYANTSEAPDTVVRVVRFQADDGGSNNRFSNTLDRQIGVTSVNDAPVLANLEPGDISYIENAPAVLITSTITISDVDTTVLVGATVSITGGFQSGADVLEFVNQNGITGSYTAGVLTLTGIRPLQDYQTALRSVTYRNTSDSPTGATRIVSFVVNDGAPSNNLSSAAVRRIAVTPVNDAPTDITLVPSTVAENLPSGTTVGTLSAVDPDVGDTATFSFAAGGADNSSFTISGAELKTAAVFDFEVKNSYSIAVRATDSGGLTFDKAFTVGVTNVNEAPTNLNISTAGGTSNVTVNSATVASGTLIGTLSAVDQDAGETFIFSLVPGSGDTDNASFAVSGVELRTATTLNASTKPVYNLRLRVTDSGGLTFERPFTVTLKIPPTIGNVGGPMSYTENAAATSISTTVTVTDPDSTNLVGATIQITGGCLAEDVLSFANTANITGSYTANCLMTLSGTDTVASYQTALRNVKYNNTSEAPSTAQRTVTWIANDGIVGSAPVTSAINVTAVNDAPVITRPATATVNEDTAFTFSGGNVISIADVDAASGALAVTLGVTSGVLNLSGTAGLSPLTGNGTNSISASGTLASLNTALNGMTYQGTLNFSGSDTLNIGVNDNGNTGSGGNQTDAKSTAITVTAVNDPPVNQVPVATQTIGEDATLTFSTANGNAITVSDVDAGSGDLTVDFTTTAGTIALGTTVGLTSSSGNGTNHVIATGTITALNLALNGTTFTPTLNLTGAQTITMLTSDNGNTGSGGAQSDSDVINVTITAVNDPPVITRPVSVTATEDTDFTFTGAGNVISIADVDAGSGNLTVTLGVTSGTLTLSGVAGLSFTTGDGTADPTIVFTGTITDVNAALNGIKYRGNLDFNGSDTLNIGVNDNGNTGTGGNKTDSQSTTINVTAVNDAPINSIPGTQTFSEDTNLTFSTANGNAITVSDVDAGSGDLTVDFTTTAGTIALGTTVGLTSSSGNNTNHVIATGTITALNLALNGTTFTPNLNVDGAQTITMLTSDNGNTGTGGAKTDTDPINLSISAVNDAPVITRPVSVTATEDTDFTFTGAGNVISIADVDAGSGNLTVTLGVASGTLTLSGVAGLSFTTGDGTADPTIVFTGTMTDVNAALNGMKYRGNLDVSGSDTLNIGVNDNGNTGTGGSKSDSQSTTINVTAVNDPPFVTAGGVLNYNEGQPDTEIDPGILVVDVDTANLVGATAQIGAGFQTLQEHLLCLSGCAGLSQNFDTVTGKLTLSGNAPPSTYQAALRLVAYEFDGDNPVGSPRTITWIVDDGQALNNLSTPKTSTVNITAVNDPPVNTFGSNPVSMNQDTTLTLSSAGSNGIQISDPDAGANPVKVTLTATNGTMTLNGTAGLSFTTGDGTADASMVFTGTITNINSRLDGMTFTPTTGFFSPPNATIQITTDDQGFTGSPGPLTDTDTLSITVNQQNQPPLNSVPGAQTVNEDTNLVFSSGTSNLISISDPDAGGASNIEVTLTVTNGTLSLPAAGGFPAMSGFSTISRTGTIANLNAGMVGMAFVPTPNFNGAASLTITTNDHGSTGPGGDKTDTDVVGITVNAVNDPPSFTKGANQTVDNQDSSGNPKAYTGTPDPWATAISQGPNETGQTLTFILNITGHVATTCGTPTDLFTVEPVVSASGTLTFTTDPAQCGTANISIVLQDNGGGTDTSPAQTFTITTVLPAPVANDDSMTALANISRDSANITPTALDVRGNDTVNGGTITGFGPTSGTANGTAPGTEGASAQGGRVTLRANGTFLYDPPAGFEGADEFFYTLGNISGSDTAKVTLTVGDTGNANDKIWFVNNAGGACSSNCDGRLSHPFTTLAAFQAVNDGTGNHPAASDWIFLSTGGSPYTGGVTLLNNQRLIGQAASASLSTITGVTPPSGSPSLPSTAGGQPVVTNSSGNGVTIGTGNSNTLRGVNLGNASSSALANVASFGTLTVTETDINTTGRALNLVTGTLSATFGSITSGGGTNNVSLLDVQTIGTAALGSGALAGATAEGFQIGGQNGSFSYSGTVTNASGTLAVSIFSKTGGSVTLSGNINPAAAGKGIEVFSNSTGTNTITFSGSQKKISSASAHGVNVDTNSGATIAFTNGGLDITTTTGTGFKASGGGAVSVSGSGNTISSGTGTALDLAVVGVGTGITFQSASSSGAATGVKTTSVTQPAGSSGIAIQGGSIAGATSRGVDIDIVSADVSIAASVASTAAGRSVEVTNSGASGSGNTIAFTGAITDPGLGINLDNNDQNNGATITFSGGLNITSGGSAGFTATNGGTVNVTGSSNTITTSTGTALNVSNTAIGSSGLTFRSISANGAANGIVLDTTGSSGGLTVTGNSNGNCGGVVVDKNTAPTAPATADCTGGTIQNAATGIRLNSTQNVSLTRMHITGTSSDNFGIYGTSVTGFTMAHSVIDGSIGATTGGQDAPLVLGKSDPSGINGLAGTNSVTDSTISGGIEHNFEVYQQSGAFTLNITRTAIQSNSAATGSDGFLIETQGTSSGTVVIDNSHFNDNRSQASQANSIDSSTLDITVKNSWLRRVTQGNEGLVYQTSENADMIVHFTNNRFTGILGAHMLVGHVALNANAASNLTANISGNNSTVGASGGPYPSNRTIIAFPSSSTGGQVSTANILIDNNTINTFSDPVNGLAEPLFVGTPDPGSSPSFTATVTNNTVNITDTGGTALRGIAAGVQVAGPTGCFDVRNNDVNYLSGAPGGVNGIRVGFPARTVQLEQGASAGSAATVLAANNPLSTTEVLGTVTVVSNSTCLAAPS